MIIRAVLLISLTHSSALLAQGETPANESIALDDVIITASPQSYIHPSELPGEHERILSEVHANSFIDLERILNQSQGVQIRQIGGLGQFSYPNIRGASGKQIQVFWDGLPLTGLNDGSSSLPSVGLSTLQAIDVYKGTLPVELGASAIGGALHLVSKENLEDSAEISAGIGSYSSKTLGGFISQKYNRWELLAGIDGLQSNNDFEFEQTRNSINSPNKAVIEKRQNNAAQQSIGLLRLNYQASKSWKLAALIQHLYFLRELSSFNNNPDNQAFLNNKHLRSSLKARYLKDKNELNTWVSYYQSKQIYNDEQSNIGLGAQLDQYKTQGKQARISFKHNFEKWLALISLHYQKEAVASEDLRLTKAQAINVCNSTGDCPSEYTREQKNIGSRLQFFPFSVLSFSGQYNVIWLEDTTESSYGYSTETENERHYTYDLGANLNLGEHHKFSILYAFQLRPVATYERFGDRGMTVGNPNLQSETSKGISASFVSEFRRIRTSIAGYQRKRFNAISGEADSRGILRFSNTALTLHQGIELGLKLNITDSLIFNTTSGYHKQTIEEENLLSLVGNLAPNQRRWDDFYELSYEPKNWRFGLSYLRQAGGFYDAFNLIPMPIKDQLNFKAGYEWKNASVMLDLINLNNNRTSDFASYPAMGRQAYLKFRYAFY